MNSFEALLVTVYGVFSGNKLKIFQVELILIGVRLLIEINDNFPLMVLERNTLLPLLVLLLLISEILHLLNLIIKSLTTFIMLRLRIRHITEDIEMFLRLLFQREVALNDSNVHIDLR